MYEFVCPHCSIPLRVRDESFRNRTIPCPECRQPVLIQDSPQGLVCLPGEAFTPVDDSLSTVLPRRRLPSWRTFVGGLTAIILVVVALRLLIRPVIVPESARVHSDSLGDPSQPPFLPAEPSSDPRVVVPVLPGGEPQDPLGEQLREIFRLTQTSGKALESVSGDPSAANGLSWIAVLAAAVFPEAHPHWDRGWNDPVNDEFVRRRFPQFDNPLVPQKAGEDNYPATHFAGVSGVGADAADLPRTHPRAGAFSRQGLARPGEFKDGLSNTILVAGVESQLGSWASPGRATIRSFSREPYVQGPDGFGTGQPGEMSVLMADGSVKTLSAKTDPVIVRRMAAISDGVPLSPQIPGDPLTLPAAATPPRKKPAAVMLDAADPPLVVELAPEVPVLDLKPRLSQRIASFETVRPIPLQQVLKDVQELIGITIETDGLSEEVLGQAVTLSLQNKTAEEIVRELAGKAGVSCEVLQDRIRFVAAP